MTYSLKLLLMISTVIVAFLGGIVVERISNEYMMTDVYILLQRSQEAVNAAQEAIRRAENHSCREI